MKTEITARAAIANCLLMGRGMYPSPEEWADAVLKRLAHDGFVVIPREETDSMINAALNAWYKMDKAWKGDSSLKRDMRDAIAAALKEVTP